MMTNPTTKATTVASAVSAPPYGPVSPQACRDGSARAGDARDEGQCLGEAVEDAVLVGELVQRALLLPDGVRYRQDHTEDDEHGRDDPQAAEG